VRVDTKASGDLLTTARLFPWAVEVKRREGWSTRELIAGRKSPVWGWWRQAQAAAEEGGLEPMLWFRRNRGEWLLMLGRDAVRTHRLLLGGEVPVTTWERVRDDVGVWWPVLVRADALLVAPAKRFA
jgi:hypothetical protein